MKDELTLKTSTSLSLTELVMSSVVETDQTIVSEL